MSEKNRRRSQSESSAHANWSTSKPAIKDSGLADKLPSHDQILEIFKDKKLQKLADILYTHFNRPVLIESLLAETWPLILLDFRKNRIDVDLRIFELAMLRVAEIVTQIGLEIVSNQDQTYTLQFEDLSSTEDKFDLKKYFAEMFHLDTRMQEKFFLLLWKNFSQVVSINELNQLIPYTKNKREEKLIKQAIRRQIRMLRAKLFDSGLKIDGVAGGYQLRFDHKK